MYFRPKSTFVFSALRKSAGEESGGDTAKTQLYIRFLHLFLRVGLSEAQKSPPVWFSPRGVFQPPKAQKVRPGGEKGGEKRKSQLYIRFLLRFLLLWATSWLTRGVRRIGSGALRRLIVPGGKPLVSLTILTNR